MLKSISPQVTIVVLTCGVTPIAQVVPLGEKGAFANGPKNSSILEGAFWNKEENHVFLGAAAG